MSQERVIPRIDISNFEERVEEISEQILAAAKNSGFFILCNQESPSVSDISKVFERSSQFFAQLQEDKEKRPFIKLQNTGYEYLSQVRPSTLTIDQKESLQLQYHRKDTYWPETLEPEWNEEVEQFILKTQKLSRKLLSIFEKHLKLPENFLSNGHDITKDTSQSTLRMLHYFPTEETGKKNIWGAGPHTDFDTLTLLFQQSSDNPQGNGLEICPGRETFTSFGYGDQWTPAPAKLGDIVVNIGDMLMSWSDDEFKSTFHRVRLVTGDKDRYSVVWFNQLNTDVEIQGPNKKYPLTTGKKFIEDAMMRNYSRLNL